MLAVLRLAPINARHQFKLDLIAFIRPALASVCRQRRRQSRERRRSSGRGLQPKRKPRLLKVPGQLLRQKSPQQLLRLLLLLPGVPLCTVITLSAATWLVQFPCLFLLGFAMQQHFYTACRDTVGITRQGVHVVCKVRVRFQHVCVC